MAQPEVVHVDPNELGVWEIESLCMNCHENGTTKILPVKIPFFKEILLESFDCDHCGFNNKTVKDAGQIQEKGTRYTFTITKPEDFQRQIVKNDTALFEIQTLELEMPTGTGQLTNLEGIFSKIIEDLNAGQEHRKDNPTLHQALETLIQKIQAMVKGEAFPVVVTLDDPTGNSFIEPDRKDSPATYLRHDYLRTHAQNLKLGLVLDDEEAPDVPARSDLGDFAKAFDALKARQEDGDMDGVDVVDNEIFELQVECPACSQPCTVNAKKTKIPHFKDVIIMATNCEHCGYRSADVKTGGEVPEKGRRITLQIKTLEDMSRDILKSETCALISEELGLEVQPGTLGGRFTTVEGLLTQIRDQLHGQIFSMGGDLEGGDSMDDTTKKQWDEFFAKLDSAFRVDFPFDIVLEDPLANSFVQKNVDEGDDPQITIQDYERTEQEMEELGLNDMKTEGYENDGDVTEKKEIELTD